MSDDAPAAPEDDTEQSELSLGTRLRTAREARELSLEKIADELRIETHVLHALEEDRLSDIRVAPVFIKGYIKQYGRLLALDYDELLEAYRRQADAEDIRLRPNRAILLRDERQITLWIVAALTLLLVAVALFVWWLGENDNATASRSGPNQSDPVSVAAPIATRSPAPVPEQAQPPPQRTAAARAPAVPAPPAPDPADGAVPTQAERLAGDVGDDRAAASDDAVADDDDEVAGGAEMATAENQSAVPPFEVEPGSVAMVFEFTAESWFELTDARDRRLHYDLADAGSQLNFMVLPPARVLLGNADAVTITVASQTLAVPRTSLRGNVASFVIDPAQD